MNEAVQRLIESREVAKGQISASVDRADSSYAAASVTAQAAIASAIIYLADAILFGFTPQVEVQEVDKSEVPAKEEIWKVIQ